jgi:hypothetical protein
VQHGFESRWGARQVPHASNGSRRVPRIAPCSSTWGDGGAGNRKGDRSQLVPHVDEQAALKRIIGLREQGRGARKIAAALNEQGANPRSGKPWTPENVATILRRLERWEAAGVDALAA